MPDFDATRSELERRKIFQAARVDLVRNEILLVEKLLKKFGQLRFRRCDLQRTELRPLEVVSPLICLFFQVLSSMGRQLEES
jgi:hypothetical protein